MKLLITESQYRKILIREFGEGVEDPKIWYRRILEFVDKPRDLKFVSTPYEVTAYDDKGIYLGYYDKENNFGFVVTEYGVDKFEDDDEILDEQEQTGGGSTDAPSGSSVSKWEVPGTDTSGPWQVPGIDTSGPWESFYNTTKGPANS